MLKRKNEESEEPKDTHTTKRVALDAEVVEKNDMEEDKQKTSVSLVNKIADIEYNGVEVLQPVYNNNISETKDDDANDEEKKTGPISSHKVQNDDPTYVHFRMLATISETAAIVGKGGDSISKIKDLSNARVNVSENLKGIPERVISVRGPAEFVAKAFGLISRIILDEPLDVASSLESKQYNLRLLFPHTIMGYIIGKKGARFREIEENSAAALKANDQILPASTDRILNISGVADAVHIATYYVAQTVIEHKQQMSKAIYYNPANYNQPVLQSLSSNIPLNQVQNQQRQYLNQPNNGFPSMMGMPSNMMGMYSGSATKQQVVMSPNGFQYQNMMPQQNGNPSGQNLQSMVNPILGMSNSSSNTTTGNTVTGPDGKINQELFVPQRHIGLIIGKGGKNLKDIRAHTGCYVKVNDEIPGETERKLTLIGNVYGIQNAIMLINNKIENEKLRHQREQKHSENIA